MRRVAALQAHLRPSSAAAAEPKKSDQLKELEAMGNTDEQGTPTDNKEKPRDGVLRMKAGGSSPWWVTELIEARGAPYEYRRVPRLPSGSVELKDFMEENGFAVVRSVLSRDECETALSMIWSDVEAKTGATRADPSTWSDVSVDVHSEALWWVRGHPAVAEVWAGLLGTDELVVSYDGASLWKPWGIDEEWKTGGMGLHCDRAAFATPSQEVRIPCRRNLFIFMVNRRYLRRYPRCASPWARRTGRFITRGS